MAFSSTGIHLLKPIKVERATGLPTRKLPQKPDTTALKLFCWCKLNSSSWHLQLIFLLFGLQCCLLKSFHTYQPDTCRYSSQESTENMYNSFEKYVSLYIIFPSWRENFLRTQRSDKIVEKILIVFCVRARACVRACLSVCIFWRKGQKQMHNVIVISRWPVYYFYTCLHCQISYNEQILSLH